MSLKSGRTINNQQREQQEGIINFEQLAEFLKANDDTQVSLSIEMPINYLVALLVAGSIDKGIATSRMANESVRMLVVKLQSEEELKSLPAGKHFSKLLAAIGAMAIDSHEANN